ncbi:MAG: cytochrome c peroxidase [Dehalococcoidia bacterium]|jgi:cytochrome c peroxidase|nr:cytochrome c peroxidase [Dehalococcoidia bacterium]
MPIRSRWIALGAAAGITVVVIAVIAVILSGGDDSSAPTVTASPTPSSADGSFVPLTAFQARVLGFDLLDEVELPEDNPFTEAKSELGRLLFFDPRLSGNSAVSCASCHQPAQGWGDGLSLSFGYAGSVHWRNTPTVINSAFHPKLDWDGKALRLDIQAQGAMKGAVAMNMDPVMVEERLRQIPDYVKRFDDVFGPGGPWFTDASRAIAAFQSTILSTNAPFDRFLEGDEAALSESAQRGFKLFTTTAGCSACHRGRLFTDEDFHGLGVPVPEDFSTDPIREITFRYQLHARGVSEDVYRSATDDPGLYLVTKIETDFGQFRTPMLRELGQTAPYMHNGAFATLEEVIDFYDAGGGESPNLDPLISPLGLTEQEKADLLAFLHSLTGDPVLVEEPELPPYEVIE